jgi:monomeric isocitrate dehydrogenase
MAETDKFKKWLRVEFMKRTGEHYEMERQITESLTKVKLEVKIDGKWTEVKENLLVDDPDLFDTTFLNLRV